MKQLLQFGDAVEQEALGQVWLEERGQVGKRERVLGVPLDLEVRIEPTMLSQCLLNRLDHRLRSFLLAQIVHGSREAVGTWS